MRLTLEGFVMFLHVVSAIVGLMMAAVLHTALIQSGRAVTIEQMRPWVPVIHRLEPLLPLAAIVLFGSGAWLIVISHGEFRWTDGWIVIGIVGLVAAEVAGAAVAPRSKAFRAGVMSAPDGPVPVTVRRQALDPAIWYPAHFATAVFLGVVFVMSAKPPGLLSALAVVLAAAIGLATAFRTVRQRPGEETSAITLESSASDPPRI